MDKSCLDMNLIIYQILDKFEQGNGTLISSVADFKQVRGGSVYFTLLNVVVPREEVASECCCVNMQYSHNPVKYPVMLFQRLLYNIIEI